MSTTYSVDTCKKLQQQFSDLNLHRPMRITHYDAGDRLTYEMDAVADGTDNDTPSRVTLTIEKFVGGGFAGQVYKVRVLDRAGPAVPGLVIGDTYALKVLIPPSGFSLFFRNTLYAIGFQGPFQLQTNPAAARSGAIWQKFIRRAASLRFGDELSVNDVHATFVDHDLGSCGEISNWVDGRTWRLEVNDRMDLMDKWERGKPIETALLGSPEYRAKKSFMNEFVNLLEDLGAYEFARQYEWTTWKSQPNCLKRTCTDDDVERGLTAVDFRAGLTLLPFLPMSPGDILLILKGLRRGSLVQFDRGDLDKLSSFIDKHSDQFDDMTDLFKELKKDEDIYRNSLIDITHNHVRLLYDKNLWRTINASAVTGWRVGNSIDEEHEKRLREKPWKATILSIIGIIPFLGVFVRKLWGNSAHRRHYTSILTNFGYFLSTMRGRRIEAAIDWHRDGRVSAGRAERIAHSPVRYMLHLPFSILPVGVHRLFTDWDHLKATVSGIILYPIKLYFNADLREQWMREMVEDGRKKHIISDEDAEVILSRIKEPYIQKYLKSLAVHVCTAPVTQLVSLIIAGIYLLTHPETPTAQAWATAGAIIAAFQVVPISPGSLARGLYVMYLVIRERNFKDYNIAVFLGFFKYVGYLAFPIQMTYRYPTLARFMAAHWATEAVHIVPVFGESGALLEHRIFSLFYNRPLTVRGRMKRRADARATMKARWWHIPIAGLISVAILGSADYFYLATYGILPGLRDLAWLLVLVPALCGALITIGAGGMSLTRRVIVSAAGAATTGALHAVLVTGTARYMLEGASTRNLISALVWQVFIFGIVGSIAAVIAEIRLPEPKAPRSQATATDTLAVEQ